MEPSAYASLAADVETQLRTHVLACWFPRCVDMSAGGFHQSYDRAWTPEPDPTKSLVFQSRMTWVLATVARRRSDLSPRYSQWASHGLEFLCKRFWDRAHGGFIFYLDNPCEKHSYAMAFGIFAAAACHRNGQDQKARELALRAFEWWDDRAYDHEHGGYFEALERDGAPLLTSARSRDLIRVPYGLRSANTLVHVIEALTELYRATLNERVRARLEHSLTTLEHTVASQGGRLFTTYTRDWRPVNRTVSYGHDVEAAYLSLDARQALGWEIRSPTERLLDRALSRGLDRKHGGFYLGRKWLRPYLERQKLGWTQAEALNAFCFMQERTYGEDSRYLDAFLNVWRFVVAHLVDRREGGWFGVLDPGGKVRDGRKGHRWKACYHSARALLNASDTFQRLSRPPAP